MNVEELLEKYFEGHTSCEEERRLRIFFASDSVPEHLKVYRPLFVYINQEAETYRHVQPDIAVSQVRRSYRLYYLIAGSAAVVLLAMGITVFWQRYEKRDLNYTIIDGKYSNDPKLVQVKALEALRNVGFTDEELKENIIISELLP